MGKINDSFEHYIDYVFGGRDKISAELYTDMQKCYYTAYASCYDFFKHDIVALPEKKAVFEIYLLEREFKKYLQDIANQIHEIVKKHEQN